MVPVARAEELARDPVPGDRADERPPAPGVEALAERVRPTDLARDRRLPVLPALEVLLPASGLRRGTTAAVDARPGVAGATSMALALAAGASRAGSWVAAVGLGSLGLVAASELGVAFERLALVADPGRERAGWASVVAALVDGFDVVLVAADCRLRAPDTRRLVARVRERGAVLVAVGGELPGERSALRLTVTSSAVGGAGGGVGVPAGPAGDRRGRGPGRGVPRAPGRAVAARPRRHGGGGRAGGRAHPARVPPAVLCRSFTRGAGRVRPCARGAGCRSSPVVPGAGSATPAGERMTERSEVQRHGRPCATTWRFGHRCARRVHR